MERVILRDHTHIPPFAESARELRILNKPLWLLQRDILKTYCKGNTEIDSIDDLARQFSSDVGELLVCRDNIYFNDDLIAAFLSAARLAGRACQIAFKATSAAGRGDPTIERHALQLSTGLPRHNNVTYLHQGQTRQGDVYLGDLYYFPNGPSDDVMPVVIETLSHEMGYYHIPSYMASQGDLTYQIPLRPFLPIESWVHVFMANVLMGVFTMAAAQDVKMGKARLKQILRWSGEDWRIFPAKLLFSTRSILMRLNPMKEMWRNHFLASPALVRVGKNCSIDPSATIHGPTIIGDNVYIGPGVVIANSIIGNNVNVMQGSQVMLSVVSDRCFLPFNAGLFMTTLMENTMVAQNSTLQLTVVGRNTFIGANNCFTDFNLQNEPIKVIHRGEPTEVNLPVLGSAVGHNVKIGSGFVIYPGRMIESNAVIIFDNEQSLIRKTVPGHDLNDVDETTGEPQRLIYHWPNVFHDPASPTPPPPAPRPPEATEPPHPTGNGNGGTPLRNESASPASLLLDHERPTVGVSASVRRSER
ncbi:MAG: multidrug transporter [Oscillochloridaceae bacterium umkhey_bin13]